MCRISNVCFDFFQLRQPEENNNIGNLTRQNGWATKDIRPKKLLGVWKQSASRNKNNQKVWSIKVFSLFYFLKWKKSLIDLYAFWHRNLKNQKFTIIGITLLNLDLNNQKTRRYVWQWFYLYLKNQMKIKREKRGKIPWASLEIIPFIHFHPLG